MNSVNLELRRSNARRTLCNLAVSRFVSAELLKIMKVFLRIFCGEGGHSAKTRREVISSDGGII